MHGLTSQEAAARLQKYGPNVIEGKKRTPLIVQFFAQFKDLMVIILIVASIFAYFAGEGIDALIIIGIVILNATIGFIQEFKAERAIEALQKLLSPKARVLRDGQELLIEARHLVPGDLVILTEGDKVGADGELLEERELRADEAILTGESIPVKKNTSTNKELFMGTQITHGVGKCLITKTGKQTQFGRIALLTSETKKDKSPLQKELTHIGAFVGKITIGIAVVLILVDLLIRGKALLETLLFAVAVAVAAVPEGLPTTITVALALGVQRLAKKNAIVKQLSSVETLGSTTVICSDKTGTLTKNQMTVQEMILPHYDILVRGVGYAPEGSFSVHYNTATKEPEYFEYEKKDLSEVAFKRAGFYSHFELALRTAVLCNNAKLFKHEGEWGILGDPTEGALLTTGQKAGFKGDYFTEKHERIYENPFDSVRKRMSVVARAEESRKLFAYVKGAPDALLGNCTHILQNGKINPLTEEQREKILKRTELMAHRALRTIALAFKELPDTEVPKEYQAEGLEEHLVFIGLMGMTDPPREEVKDAIKLTHRAGIRVFIITGDHGLTAHAIAKELGIVKSYGVNIITGDVLRKMSDEKLLGLVAPGQETIFARANPEDKLRIVTALKAQGEIVAVTGDGVNDAPALKRADIGIAMGITGTDVSKEAANMILTDDSFSTIVSAVIEGRTIYANMKRSIFFIFSSNIGELLTVLFAILMGIPSPLTAIFLLIINTLTDVFPALALGVEPVGSNVLDKAPRKSTSRIMEKNFILSYLAAGVWIGLLTLGIFIYNLVSHGWHFGEPLSTDSALYIQSATLAFATLTIIQMVHAWNCRTETTSVFRVGFFKNIYLIGAVIFSVGMTLAIVYIPFLQNYLKTAAPEPHHWLIIGGVAVTILLFEETRKYLVRRTKRSYAVSR